MSYQICQLLPEKSKSPSLPLQRSNYSSQESKDEDFLASEMEKIIRHFFGLFFELKKEQFPTELRISQKEIDQQKEKIKLAIDETLKKSLKSLTRSPFEEKEEIAKKLSYLLFNNQERKPKIIITEDVPIKIENISSDEENEIIGQQHKKPMGLFKIRDEAKPILMENKAKTKEEKILLAKNKLISGKLKKTTGSHIKNQISIKKNELISKKADILPLIQKKITKRRGKPNQYLMNILCLKSHIPLQNSLDKICGFVQVDDYLFCECHAQNQQTITRFEICLNMYKKIAENKNIDWKISSINEDLSKRIGNLKDYVSKNMKSKVLSVSKLIINQILKPKDFDHFKKRIEVEGEDFNECHIKRVALIVDTVEIETIETTKYSYVWIDSIEERENSQKLKL